MHYKTQKYIAILLFFLVSSVNAAEWSGLFEFDGVASRNYESETGTGLTHATLELGFNHNLQKDLDFEVVFLYEEESENSGEVDHAVVRFYEVLNQFEITLGQQYLNFGQFESNLISDPFTLEIAESRQTAINIDTASLPVKLGASVYKGELQHTTNEWFPDWLIHGKYEHAGALEFSLMTYYSSEFMNAANWQEVLADAVLVERVPGIGIAMQVNFQNSIIDAECLGATRHFEDEVLKDKRPMACHLEFSHQFLATRYDWTLAVGYSHTTDAQQLELPESRTAAALTAQVMKNVKLGFEWANKSDYQQLQGGSGRNAQEVVAQLAVGF